MLFFFNLYATITISLISQCKDKDILSPNGFNFFRRSHLYFGDCFARMDNKRYHCQIFIAISR